MFQLHKAPRGALSSRRPRLALAAGSSLAAVLPGCPLPTRLAAVPRGRASAATVLGVPNGRFLPLEAAGQAGLQREFIAAAQRQLVARGLPPIVPLPELDLLGVSGGGENGAFGASLLNGWTEHGDRPTFFLVTGISTGALSAPFAFLGSTWDAKLKSVYTDITLKNVLVRHGYTAAVWDDGMADNSPLFEFRRQRAPEGIAWMKPRPGSQTLLRGGGSSHPSAAARPARRGCARALCSGHPALSAPRTVPDGPCPGIRLSFRVFDGEALVRLGMEDARFGSPVPGQLGYPLSHHARLLVVSLEGGRQRWMT